MEEWARQERAEAVHGLFSAIGRGLAGFLRGAGRVIKSSALGLANGYGNYRRWRRRRAAIRDLNALSDHVLKDIGLVRGDIRTVVDGLLDGERQSRAPLRSVESAPERRARVAGDSASRDTGEHDWRRAA